MTPSLAFEVTPAHSSARVEAWDELVQRSPRGHYTLLSSWLRAYEAFGLKAHIFHALDRRTGSTVGGAGFVMGGIPGFRVASVPYGPFAQLGSEHDFGAIYEALVAEVHARGAGFVQLQLPSAIEADAACTAVLDAANPARLRGTAPGAPLAFALAPAQFLLVDLAGPDDPARWRASMLRRFSSNAARNIKASWKQQLAAIDARDPDTIRRAFTVIEANGREQGYATRSWAQFGRHLSDQVAAGHARVLLAIHDGRDVGAHYALIAGRRYSYMMGGTVRLQNDLKVGHFLHFRAIEIARELGLDAYDLTSGGSDGVMRFKMGFSPRKVALVAPVHVPFSPVRVRLVRRGFALARKYKRQVGRVVHQLSGVLRR